MRRDGRKLDHKTLEEIRRMAVERVWEGEDPSEVIASYGFCRTTIYKWLRAAKGKGKGRGLDVLRSRKGTGRPPKLTKAQQRQVFRWINGKDPRQHGFDFGLWTRRVVSELVVDRFGIDLSLASVGKVLANVGLTPQKPLTRAYERDPEAIEAWKRETYPSIAAAAKRSGAEIYFWDESGFRADAVQGTTWGVKGETPVVEVPGKRQTISAASAVNSKGGFWFATYQGGMSAELFVAMLKLIMRGRRKPLYLILDSLPAHKAKVVRDYEKATNGKLKLFFLPGYAPELNPDELVWSYVKRTGTAKRPLASNESLQDRIEADLINLQNSPGLIRSFFKAPDVAYITDSLVRSRARQGRRDPRLWRGNRASVRLTLARAGAGRRWGALRRSLADDAC
jgi:transposase